ncbi:uncharacterized protein LOC126737295 [Anthonomus grandis grandis]|uniref:uncharacterized protein LOC126737295 n=1 Tax=Anthonomus grandis grandis TaxID=2921223 RepID=UPI0021650C5B|nr:uncharacterized protein LOC126737295 [Anthonomus grandis grandis]
MMAALNHQLRTEIYSILEHVAKSKNIENYQINPESFKLQLGDGFVCLFFKAALTDKDTNEIIEVAIKKASNRPLDYNNIFGNEIAFYSKLIPALNNLQGHLPAVDRFNNIPDYYTSSREPQKEFIALENLSPQGYFLYDKSKYWDQKHLEKIFTIYGKFHALSFVLRRIHPELYNNIISGCKDICAQLTVEGSDLMEAAMVDAVTALDMTSKTYDIAKELVGNVKNTLLEALRYNGDFRCITHGDCWSNNMLFKYGDNGEILDVKLIDFQLMTERTPIHDLSYFFYSGASKEDMDNLEFYLQIYYESFSKHVLGLKQNPEEVLPFITLKKEWKENGIIGVMLSIHLWQLKLLPKENFIENLREKNIEKKVSDQETREHFVKILKEVRKSEDYQKRTKDILVHACEYGVVKKEKIVKVYQ